jgi:uncharacterized protein YggT (Ycf19 family)
MEALIQVLATFLQIYILCVFAWALMSWLPLISPQLAYNEVVVKIRAFLDSVVMPYIKLFSFVPPVRIGGAMLDLSALVGILVLVFFGPVVIQLLESVLVPA